MEVKPTGFDVQSKVMVGSPVAVVFRVTAVPLQTETDAPLSISTVGGSLVIPANTNEVLVIPVLETVFVPASTSAYLIQGFAPVQLPIAISVSVAVKGTSASAYVAVTSYTGVVIPLVVTVQ